MSRLAEIFQKHGTDKYVNGYAGVYECLFHDVPVHALLEVGIGSMNPDNPCNMINYARAGYRPGGSLRAWREYFGCPVYGMDCDPSTQFKEEGITTFQCDSTDREAVKTVLGALTDFAVIIDDGGHDVDSQLKTLANLYDRVALGGFYIIEDVMPGNASILGHIAPKTIGPRPCFFLGPNNNMMVIRKV